MLRRGLYDCSERVALCQLRGRSEIPLSACYRDWGRIETLTSGERAEDSSPNPFRAVQAVSCTARLLSTTLLDFKRPRAQSARPSVNLSHLASAARRARRRFSQLLETYSQRRELDTAENNNPVSLPQPAVAELKLATPL